MMSFDEFCFKGTEVPCLLTALPEGAVYTKPGVPGRVYPGCTYIHGTQENGYDLTIANCYYAGRDLRSLEAILYAWACDEGCIE